MIVEVREKNKNEALAELKYQVDELVDHKLLLPRLYDVEMLVRYLRSGEFDITHQQWSLAKEVKV